MLELANVHGTFSPSPENVTQLINYFYKNVINLWLRRKKLLKNQLKEL